MSDLRKVFVLRKEAEKRILGLSPNIPALSGIYVFYRLSEEGIKFAYIGQAKSLLDRCSSHLLGYQAIDCSIKKHGLFNQTNNPNGYNLIFKQCSEEMLDENERKTILYFANNGFQLKNKTTGGQNEGKKGLGENKPSKGYHDGLKRGYSICQFKVKTYFEKYLDYSIKGTQTKLKERKLNEFKIFLEDDNELLGSKKVAK